MQSRAAGVTPLLVTQYGVKRFERLKMITNTTDPAVLPLSRLRDGVGTRQTAAQLQAPHNGERVLPEATRPQTCHIHT